MNDLLVQLQKARVYDLAQPYFTGMPHYPTHAPYLYSLSKLHGEYVSGDGISSAAESIAMGAHVGTHMDALCHYSQHGRLHGAVEAAGVQTYGGGVRHLSIDTVAAVVRRGVMLDIAGLHGTEPLPAEFSVTPGEIERACAAARVQIEAGDVVLLRTGWARYFDEPSRYIAEVRGPGPELEGARWLSDRKPFAVGSDTVAFEKVPSGGNPVHAHLLVDSGIHIFETLNLEDLARDRVHEFLFVAAPLKLRGGTAGPVRPLAIAL